MITYRLADSLPRTTVEELRSDPALTTSAQRRQRLEELLDAGYGACHLRIPQVAKLVEDALLYFNGERYRLNTWVIMPNHVHFLIETISEHPLSGMLHSLKSFTAKKANKLLGRAGQLWQMEYFDRAIRDERHWLSAIQYIYNNPVKAGLVERAEDWVHSSARLWGARGGREQAEAGAGGTPAVPALGRMFATKANEES